MGARDADHQTRVLGALVLVQEGISVIGSAREQLGLASPARALLAGRGDSDPGVPNYVKDRTVGGDPERHSTPREGDLEVTVGGGLLRSWRETLHLERPGR